MDVDRDDVVADNVFDRREAVIGPVTNIDAFYEAFDVKEGDKLFKPKSERIKIW